MAINRGRFGLADAYCREAMTLAEQAGDEGLQAWVRGTQSFGAYYAGDFPRALDFARGGLRHANGGPQAVRLLINGVARALGKMGDARGVIETVAEAYKVLEGTRVPDGLSPCISLGPYSAARLAANAATAFLALGDVDRVLEFAGQVEELVEASESDWSRALVRIDVATALLRSASPEVEHAMELGTEALAATAGKPIRSVWQRLRELDIQASPWSQEPEVREFDEHLRSWMSQPEHQAACGDQELTTR
jgi:tetratricopeptide (TPR) repeat protein